LAKNGRKFIDEELQNVYLRLYDGQIYQNLDEGDNKNLSISNFKVFDIMIYDPSSSRKTIIPSLNDKNSNTSFLYDLKNLNELVYRLSISLSLLIISIISIQISRTNFRKARNYAVGAGFLSYIIYYNLIIYVKELRFESFLEIFSNNLLPHLIFLIYFLFIYIFRNNLRFKQ